MAGELTDPVGGHLGVPVAVGHGQIDGSVFGGEDRLGERAGHIVSAQGFQRLVDEGFGQFGSLDIGEHDLGPDHVPDLLTGGDDELRLRDRRVRQGPEAVACARGGVETDQRGPIRDHRVAVGHGHDGGFVKAEDVAGGQVLEEGQLIGTGIAEDRRHPVEGHDLVNCSANRDCRHRRDAP